MVAVPNLTLTITAPGGSPTDYTSHLAWAGANNQLSVSQNFGRQGDTALIPLIDEYTTTPSFHIPVLSQVSLFDNTANVSLFAGVINDPVLRVEGPNSNEWDLQCTDYTCYADNAIVHGTYIGWTVDAIVVDLTAQANCGITAAKIANGGFVAPGVQLASFVLNYTTLSDAWRRLASLAGQVTPYGWYVDENRRLHFYDSTTAQSSGVTFTTTPTVGGSLTEGHFYADSTFGYEWDGTSVHNRILVQGANQTVRYYHTSNPPTDTWLGNGTQNSWPLRFIVTGTPVLHVNGVAVAQVVTVAAGATSTAQWQVVQNAIGAYYLINTVAAPASGTVLKIWYDYQVPIVAQASDRASQVQYNGPNGGVFAEYINDTSLVTVPMALARAQRERTEYAFAAERITFTTTEDFVGWVRAGQTCQVINRFVPDSQNSYSWGINDTFLVVANQITFGDGGYRQAQITAVRI